jgi:hypothetical protein
MDHRVQVPPAGSQVAAGLARGGMSPAASVGGMLLMAAARGRRRRTNRSRAVNSWGHTCSCG